MKQFDKYRMVDGTTPLAARYFNAVWQDLDLRLASLEEVKIAWQEAVDEVVRFGLVRIDELITEPLQAVVALSEQAQATSAELEQLRQLAQERTAALAALIDTLQADTAAQVNAFITTANGSITAHQNATAAELAAWKAQRTQELDTWVADYEAQLLAARAEIDAAIADLQAGVAALARLHLVRKALSFAPVAADTRSCFVVTAAATITVPSAAALGAGWWCEIINNGQAVVELAGAVALPLRPGARVRLHADAAAATVEVLELTPSLARRPLWQPHPGWRYLGLGLALRKKVTLPFAPNAVFVLHDVLLGVKSNGTEYWSCSDGENLVSRSFPEKAKYAKASFCHTGQRYLAASDVGDAVKGWGRYLYSSDAAKWTVGSIPGATAKITVMESDGNGRVLALAGGAAAYLSTDHGASWSEQALPVTFGWVTHFNGLFIAGVSTAVYTSATGQAGSWTSRGALPITPGQFGASGSRWLLIGAGGVGAWTEDGVQFHAVTLASLVWARMGDFLVTNASGIEVTQGSGEVCPILTPELDFKPSYLTVFKGRLWAVSSLSVGVSLVSDDSDYGFFEREAL